MRRLAALVSLFVLAGASPVLATIPEDWEELTASGKAAHACPISGTEAVVDVAVGDGSIIVLDEEGTPLSEHDLPGMVTDPADRYAIGPEVESTLAGRATKVISVVEGELLRMEVVVDPATSMPLVLTSYGGDGSPHCSLVLLDWELTEAGVELTESDAEAPAVSLPEAVAGFGIGDVVVGEGFEAALYRDGLFTFSLTRWQDELVVEGTDEAGVAELGPGRTLMSWRSGGGTFVMIGDLPPDLRATVLAELPEPDSGGFLRRIWNRLFG